MNIFITDKERNFLEISKALSLTGFGEFTEWTEELEYFILCNDVFHWAGADSEDIETVEDVHFLKECYERLGYDSAGSILYCCEKRQMRPQGACFNEKFIKEEHHKHFLKFPERSVNYFNPKKAPDQ